MGLEHNPYYEMHSDRLSWIPEDFKNPEDSEIAFFVGCTSSYREAEMSRNTFEVLKKLGIKFSNIDPGVFSLAKKTLIDPRHSTDENSHMHDVLSTLYSRSISK